MNRKALNVSRFIELNRPHLELYRKITWVLALLISLIAVVIFTGGMIRSYLDPGGPMINRFGFISDVSVLIEITLRFIITAFTMVAVTEYLRYLVRAEKSPWYAALLLPVSLLLIAMAGLYRVGESFFWIAQDLETGFGPGIIFTSFINFQLPALTRSAATIGLAIVIVHLTRVIEEEKSLV